MANDVTELNLNDTIDAKHITSKSFITGLKAANTAKVDLHINSEGGDILDGFAIYNAIKAHEAHVTAHIDGIAASIASVIAVAADKVCIAKNGYMMIHNGTVKTEGDPAALRQDADVLEKFCKTIAQAYADKSAKSGKNKTVDEFRKAMESETWFNADEAMAWGLVDEIEEGGDESRMAACAMLAVATYEHAPPALRRFAAKLARAERGTGKESAMDKIVCKDGKWYHGEAEIDVSDCVNASKAAAAPAPAKPEEEEDKEKARAQAIAKGRQDEREALTAEAKAEKEIEAECTKRWQADARLRRMHGCHAGDEGDPIYKGRLARFIAAEKKCRKDQIHAGKVGEDVESSDDPISRIMRSRSEIVKSRK
jgi:ATP-dependent Clp protease protease subunit